PMIFDDFVPFRGEIIRGNIAGSPRVSPSELIMNYPKLFALFAVAAFFSGCRSAGLDQARSLRIRTGLTQQEVKAAILSATIPDKKPREWVPMGDMSDSALRAAYIRTH